MFGGFILHFLLSNYLTVLLLPSFEEPVETAGDLVKRNITPFTGPSGVQYWTNLFSGSPNPDYQALSGKIRFAKYCEGCDDCEYCELVKGSLKKKWKILCACHLPCPKKYKNDLSSLPLFMFCAKNGFQKVHF